MNSKNENNYNITLDIENCEIDKNINAKFKDLLYGSLGTLINRFYCIISKHRDLPLFTFLFL